MAKHLVSTSPSNRFRAYYQDRSGNVAIRDERAPLWAFILDSDGTAAQVAEALTEAGGPMMDPQDMLWMANTFASVEAWQETCPHDLERFGAVGVSY